MEADKMRHKQAREMESVDDREGRMEADKNRHKQARELESVDQKEDRLEDQRIRQHQAREVETEEMKETRLQAERVRQQQYQQSREKLFLASTRDVQPFTVGKMNKVCQGCRALMFSGDTHKGKLGKEGEAGSAMFSMCCRYGNIKPPKLKEPPEFIKYLLKGKSMNNI